MSKRVQTGWFRNCFTIFLYLLNSHLSAQTVFFALQNRPDSVRAVYRYPAMYAEVRLSDRSKLSHALKPGDSNEPSLALALLVGNKPDHRLFTLDWRTENPSILYRAHFDRKRKMLWFHKIEMTNSPTAINECSLFTNVTASAFKSLGISDKRDLTIELTATGTVENSRKDCFLLRFNTLLKHGCKSAVLPFKEIPNFGSRRELFP